MPEECKKKFPHCIYVERNAVKKYVINVLIIFM